MRSNKVTSLARSKVVRPIVTFADLHLSPNDVIAFCELEVKNTEPSDEIKHQDHSSNLQKLYHERRLILQFLLNEKAYYEQLEIEDKKQDIAAQRIKKLELQYIALTQRIKQIRKQYRELADSKRLFALKLAKYYETGEYNYSAQHWSPFMGENTSKATQYLAKATNAAYSQSGFSHTTAFYKYSGLFSSARLFVLRENNILRSFHKDFIPAFSRTLFPFPFLGFSYGLELIFDIGILLKAFFQGKSVRDTFYKDDRPSRMANSIVWLACNILCFVISGGVINAVANLAAFAFDVGNECYRAKKELKKYEDLLDKVTRQISILANKENEPDFSALEKNKLEKLRCVQIKLQKKIEAVKKKRYWVIACTAALFLGMILVFFPPVFIPYATIIGTIVAFTAGSIFLGFGKRAFEWACQLKDKICSPAPKESKTAFNKLQFLQNIISKVSTKKNKSLSTQMATLNKNEMKDLRITLGLHKSDALWQQQLTKWVSSTKLHEHQELADEKIESIKNTSNRILLPSATNKKTNETKSHIKNAENSNKFFHQKSHVTFLQTLEQRLLQEKLEKKNTSMSMLSLS